MLRTQKAKAAVDRSCSIQYYLSMQEKLEVILDELCKITDRNITVFYPEKKEEIIPYLVTEIKKTLDLIK